MVRYGKVSLLIPAGQLQVHIPHVNGSDDLR